MKLYRCIFVDWYQTLSTSLFWEHILKTAHPRQHIYTPIVNHIFAEPRNATEVQAWMRGQFPVEDLLQRISQHQGCDYDEILRELIISCQTMKLVSSKVPDYIACLRAAGIRVAIATDNMDTFTRWTVPALSLHNHFDDILNSFDLHALKGDRDANGKSLFFGNYLEMHGIRPGESILLDDGNHEFAQIIRSFGIDYHTIEPGVGLVPALEMLLEGLK